MTPNPTNQGKGHLPEPLSSDMRQRLIGAAHEARRRAYARYSNYTVGAALLATNGEVFLGCNIENAAYSPTVCAERVAVFKAVSEGVTEFAAMTLVTENGGTCCGTCRQVLNEFAPDLWIISMDAASRITFEGSLRELLPYGFGPQDLDHYATP